MMNQPIKELYENAPFPAATVDANSYVTWANAAAKEKYPALFRRDGIRNLARFSDERERLARLVKNGIGATVRLCGSELVFTFTPLPDKGKELLLTLSADTREGTEPGTGLVAAAVPSLRDALSRLGESADITAHRRLPAPVSGQLADFRKGLAALQGTTDHMALYAALQSGLRPNLTICNTARFFNELLEACGRLLKSGAPAFSVRGHGWIVTDYPLAARLLLLLLANALEHGDGETAVSVTTDDELTLTVKNRLRGDVTLPSPDELKRAFTSFTAEEENNRLGIGLTLANGIASLLGGTLEVSAEDGMFAVMAVLPSADVAEPPATELKNAAEYLADRNGAVCAELLRFTE